MHESLLLNSSKKFFRSILALFTLFAILVMTVSVYAQQNYDIETKLLADDGAAWDNFGVSVSINGNTAIVGASGDNNYAGAAYIFEFNGSIWTQVQKLTASNGIADDAFGYAVSISGNKAIIGATGDNNWTGAVYFFEFNGNTWAQVQKLTPSDVGAFDEFGSSVFIQGNTAIVGIRNHNNFIGAAYIFQFNDSTWTEYQKLTASDSTQMDLKFGSAVSLSENIAIIGASGYNNDQGGAYIFEFDGSTWTEDQRLTASDGTALNYFGSSVSIYGNKAIVGAPYHPVNPGSAYIFESNGNIWNQIQKLSASDGFVNNLFGNAVTISRNTVIVGARYDDDYGIRSGSAYGYHFDGSNWNEYKMTASDGAADDEFGYSVGAGDKIAIVGSPFNDDNGSSSGSAYIYELIARPNQVTVSDGIYNNRAKISWNNRSGSVESFKIYRDGEELATTLSSARAYNDYDAVPGKISTYGVVAYNSTWGESSPVTALGWRQSNGRLDGTVQTTHSAGVADVEISAAPTATDLSTVLEFDGIDDYVNCGDNASLDFGGSESFTIEAWIQPAVNNDTCAIVSNYNVPNDMHYLLSIYDGIPLFNNPTVSISAGIYLQSNTWYHLAATYDGSDMKLYVDGDLKNSTTSGFPTSSSSTNVLIGAYYRNDTTDYHFEGKMDEVRIWNVARDSVAIQANMHRLLQGNEPGLVAYWTFNDSSRSSAVIAGDYAEGGGNHGDIYGAQYQIDSSNVRLFTITDPNGDFSIRRIYYDEEREFEVIPSKGDHGFNPSSRNATLDINTPTITSIQFTDTTTFSVLGKIQYANTVCDVAGVEIFLDGFPTGVLTDSEGEFGLSIDEPGTYTITPSFGDSIYAHTFLPAETTLFIDKDILGLQFQDTTKNLLFGKVRGPCNSVIGQAKIKIASIGHNAGLFDTSFWTDADGNFRLFFPAQPYIMYLDSIIPYNPIIIQYFSPDTADLTWENQRKNFTYRTPPIIRISGWPDFGGGNYQVPIMMQPIAYQLLIEVLDVWGTDTCHVDEGSITIYDGIADKASQPFTIPLQDGKAEYYCIAGLPNILSGGNHPYQKLIQVVAHVGEENVSYEQWAVVTGHRPRQQTFYNTSPELVLWVLRDPSGDQSYAFLAQDSSLSTFITQDFQWSTGHGAFIDLKPGAIISVGEFVSTDFGEYVIVKGDFYHIWAGGTIEGKQLTLTASEEFRTSDNQLITGAKGDVFMGASFSMIYALTDVITFDWNTNQVVPDTSVAWDIDSIATTFIYTELHIRNTLIPQLQVLRSLALSQNDTVKAEKYLNTIHRWEEELARNDSLKNAATFKRNISFSAGTSSTFAETETAHSAKTYKSANAWDAHWAVGFGKVIAGGTYEIGYQGSYYQNTVNDSTLDTTATRTIGYHLSDDDPGDFFSVSVKYDSTYRTHVFDLFGGTSSCPWEPGTQPRDGVQIDMNQYVQYNVPPEDPATFILSLGNTSQSGETREYYLSVIQASNLDGAIIRVGGVVIEDHLSYTLPAGEQLTATLTVERGPIAFDYEDLQVRFYSPCDAEAISDTVTFSVHFISPCSEVNLLIPEDNWVLNQSDNDTLQFIITDYDPNNIHLNTVKFQYRRYGENWETAFIYPKSSLPPDYIMEYWDVSALPDGSYKLRVAADCASNGVNYSAVVSGVIDRQALLVFGTPEPSDGVLNLGEDISISFSDEIDEAYVSDQNISLITRDDSTEISSEPVTYQNTLIISVSPDTLTNYSNRYLIATVSGIRDIHGNRLRNPVSWSFRVSLSPVYWTVSNVNQTVYQGYSESFTRMLRNVGSQDESFTITRYPSWLTPNPINGTIPSGGEWEINFSIDTQLNIGIYQDTVLVSTLYGEEQLLVRLEVLKEPPQWTVNPAQFSYSMSITAQVVLNGTLSRDIYDMISVFVQGECRGVANIEYVAVVGKYVAFVTTYSNVPSGEVLSFHAWDASEGREQVFLGSNYTFQSNGSIGTASNPILIEPDAYVQAIDLNQGWTWISLNVEDADMTIANALAYLSPENGDLIKGQTGFSQYQNGVGWQGNLQRLEVEESYRIYLNDTQTLRFTGLPVDIFNTPIPIDTGWNWIGFLPQQILDINDALASYTATVGDRIKSQTEFAEFLSATASWEGSLKNMAPGQGYLLKSQSGGGVNYPSFNKSSGATDARLLSFPDRPDWVVDVAAYEYNMSITALFEFNEEEMTDTTLIIGAFVNDTCRGLAKLRLLAGLERYLAFLLVYSNNVEGDLINFKIYEPDGNKTRDVEETLIFESDEIIGNLETPFVFTVLGVGDELVPYDFYLRQNYPNPFNPITTIEYGLPSAERVRLIIFNILGQKIKTVVNKTQKAGRYKISFNATEFGMASGVYFYRIKAGDFARTRKMLLIK